MNAVTMKPFDVSKATATQSRYLFDGRESDFPPSTNNIKLLHTIKVKIMLDYIMSEANSSKMFRYICIYNFTFSAQEWDAFI